MTTASTTPRLALVGDGSSTQFTFNFEIADLNSIAVYVGTSLKTLTSEYTVTFNSGTSGTGTITFISAPADAAVVYLIRDTDNIRAVDFAEGGAFFAATVNAELDRLTQGLQDLENIQKNSTLRVVEPHTETATLTLPSVAGRASKQLSFDALGNLTATTVGVGTITSITAGTGLSGGTITASGTVAIDDTVATLTGSQTLTNKIINADNNTVSNLEVDNLKTGVLDTDLTAVSASDDTLASAKAIKTYVDAQNTAQAITFVGDDSTGTAVNSGETVKVAGTQNVTTAMSGDTLTITGPDLSTYLTNSTITVVGDDSTGTTLNSNETIKIAGAQNITTAVSGDTLTITGPDLSSYATQTYVGTQITNLIDSAPGALDTLNELAAALGDDADFATTVTNSLATKVANTDTGLIVVGDDSTGTALTVGETIKIAGAGGITTAVLGDTLTITGPSGTLSNIVEDVTPELGGNLNVNGKTITNTGTNGVVRLETNGSGPITLAPGSSGIVQVTIGNFIVTQGTIENNAVSIDDNKIATYRSNDNLILDAAGTGKIQLNANITGSAGTVTVDSIVNAGSNAVKSTHTPAAGSDLTNKDYIDGQGFLTGVELSTDLSPQLGGNLDLNSRNITGTGNISITGNITATNGFITMVGDDSTGVNVTLGETFKIAGTQNITTAVSGDTLTITGPNLSTYLENIVSDTTPQLGGNLDLNSQDITGTGNISITGNIANDAVTISDNTISTTRSNDNLVLSTSGTGQISVSSKKIINVADPAADQDAATKAYVDSATAAIGGLSNIVEDTTPQLGGNLDVNSNSIVSVSNGNIIVQPNGTGFIQLGTDSIDNIKLANWVMATGAMDHGVVRTYERSIDFSTMNASSDRIYANHDLVAVTLTGSGDGTSGERIRQQRIIQLDTAGFNTPYNHPLFTSIANTDVVEITNSAVGASTLSQAMGISGGVAIGAGHSNAGDITITNAVAMSAYVSVGANDGTTVTITNAYGQMAGNVDTGGSGTSSIGTYYGLYVNDQGKALMGKAYGLYIKDDDYLSKIGKIEAYKESINALTSSSTITTNCALAPVHTVTLAINTQFNIANLGTGQTVTLIITQDGTGSRTASFGTDTSTAVKFPGGVPSLSTGAGDIDIVSVFNDGTNYLGNIAKDYS